MIGKLSIISTINYRVKKNSVICLTDSEFIQYRLTFWKLDPPLPDSVLPCHIPPEWHGQWLGYTGQWLLPVSDLWVTRGKNNLYKIKLKNQLLNSHYSIFAIFWNLNRSFWIMENVFIIIIYFSKFAILNTS